MGNYLASVVVYNLLPHEYDDLFIEYLEGAINDAMSSMRKVGFKANDENMVFSFPQNPSVKNLSIPVLVDITLFSTSNFKRGFVRHNGISEGIRKGVLSCLINSRTKGNVIVIVRQSGKLISHAPEV